MLVGNSGVLSRSGGPYDWRQLQPATSGPAITGGRQLGKGASLHRPPLKQVHQSTRRRSKMGSLLRRSKLKAAVNGGFRSHRAGGNQVMRSQSTGDDDLRLLPDIEDIPSLQYRTKLLIKDYPFLVAEVGVVHVDGLNVPGLELFVVVLGSSLGSNRSWTTSCGPLSPSSSRSCWSPCSASSTSSATALFEDQLSQPEYDADGWTTAEEIRGDSNFNFN
ncbi:hypothetical protein RHGRI_023990 [Rhododendron griersonianum]|uniref:Uncharacterized protein n=1 Tax=Rhododendron griersonianum TaxID=479676 RepID=A0AAV6J5I6_9ERIC|nr:hypothetical protein RHGRI_023990 [Rhododendron griersonianum]